LPRLRAISSRFKSQRLAILALHDASITSSEEYQKALAAVRKQHSNGEDLPFRPLLDKPLNAYRARPQGGPAEDWRHGKTSKAYEVVSCPSMFVIDRDGKIVFANIEGLLGIDAVSYRIDKSGAVVRQREEAEYDLDLQKTVGRSGMDSLEFVLEDRFGLPHARPARQEIAFPPEPLEPPKGPMVIKGRVVGPDGKPVAEAKLTPRNDPQHEKAVTTGPTGEFEYRVASADHILEAKIEAPGLASEVVQFSCSPGPKTRRPPPETVFRYWIEPTGLIEEPLTMGRGVAVTGRVVRDGQPVGGVPMELKVIWRPLGVSQDEIETRTDDQGTFRFPHVLPNQEFWAGVKVGSRADHLVVVPRRFQTDGDNEAIDLGDLEGRPGLTLAGRVICSDGKPIPREVVLFVSPESAAHSLMSEVDPSGHFEVRGLPGGPVRVSIVHRKAMEVPGYQLSPRMKCLDPHVPNKLEGRLDSDITDLTILLEPGKSDLHPDIRQIDPAAIADFREAKAGPITGLPRDVKGTQ
jgi:hypothetical protein